MTEESKNPAAVELGKLGGQKIAERGPDYFAELQAQRKTHGGGRPRNPPKATHPGKLPIGNLVVPCFVLEDGTHVITQRGMQTTVGMSASGGTGGAHRIANFVEQLSVKLSDSNDLAVRMRTPIVFQPTTGGKRAYGYEATTLIDLCELILRARNSKPKVLTPAQTRFADSAEIVVRAFAKVGIIAVIDEVTGYQEIRDRDALQKILKLYISEELIGWAKRFPLEFYKQIFRLKGWSWNNGKMPGVVGKYTNDMVYARLAPGVLEELRRLNPPNERGNRRYKHHQYLTEDVGHPALGRHLYELLGMMRASESWDNFRRVVDRTFPRTNTTFMLPFEDETP